MTFRSFLLTMTAAALALWAAAAPAPAADLRFDGAARQGGLLVGHAPPGAKVTVDGKAIPVSPLGLFLVGLGRDAAPKALVRVSLPDGSEERKTIAVARRDYDVQRVDGLPPRSVSPSAKDLKRIRAESALIKKARGRDTAAAYFVSGFARPADGTISGIYGSQRILNGQPRRPHLGEDIAAPEGTPVRAVADGVVALVHDGMFFNGKIVILDHGQGLTSDYLHLSEIAVQAGDHVKRGQRIGRVGKTGRVTGAHLHWGVALRGVRLDPALVASIQAN